VEKKLAPFYRGLEDYEEEWGEDEVIAALKEVRASQAVQAEAEAAAAMAAGGNGASGGASGVDELGSAIHLPGTSSPGGSTSGGGGSITAGSIKKGLKSAVSGVVIHKSASATAAQKEKEERERESRQVDLGERERKEARAYRGAVECPICFLVSRLACHLLLLTWGFALIVAR